MYLIKIQKYNQDNRWIKSGGNLVIEAIVNGNMSEIDSDGIISPLLPKSITEGLNLEFGRNKFYTTTKPNGIECETWYNSLPSSKAVLLQDKCGIKEGDVWSFFESPDALEFKILCLRIKHNEDCPIEFIDLHEASNFFYTLVFNLYEELSSNDIDILYEYSTFKNDRGAFVILKSIVEKVLSEQYMKILQKCNYQEFSVMNWLYYKYAKE
jgi:hypothetical protein